MHRIYTKYTHIAQMHAWMDGHTEVWMEDRGMVTTCFDLI